MVNLIFSHLQREDFHPSLPSEISFENRSDSKTKTNVVECSSHAENHDAAGGGSCDGKPETELREVIVPGAEAYEIQEGRQHFGKEIGQKDVCAGQGERHCDSAHRSDIANKVSEQPERRGDGA